MHKRVKGIQSLTNARLGRVGLLSCAVIASGLTLKVAMFARPADDREAKPRALDCGGQGCAEAAHGLGVFLDRQPDGLGGNGRACADCHMPTSNFQLSPADAEARYQNPAVPPTLRSECRRPAVPPDRRGRLPPERRSGQRLHDAPPARTDPHHPSPARRTSGSSIRPPTSLRPKRL